MLSQAESNSSLFTLNSSLPQDHTSDSCSIDNLFQRGIEHKGSDEFYRFINFIAKMEHYSRFNSMLVYAQCSAVTFFGSASYWYNKHRRVVIDDASPYVILAPRGPVLLVYDIFETWGELTPEEFMEQGIGAKIHEVKGALPPGSFQCAIDQARLWGINVTEKPLSYFNSGYIAGNFFFAPEIGLKEGLSKQENYPVLMHELGHLFLGHMGYPRLRFRPSGKEKEKEINLPDRTNLSYNICELEAETVSYLICRKMGLQPRSAEYLAGYITSKKDLEKISYETVIKTADKIEKLFCN